MRTLVVLLVSLAIHGPAAATNDCREASNGQNSATDALEKELNRYIRCLNNGDLADACSREFRKLERAQRQLEWATSERASYCRD